jgi:hypothetical protein
MKRKSSLLLITSALILSCTPVSNISVSDVSDSDALLTSSFIYALPQTVIDISVIAEQVADKYLGIKHVPVKAENIYALKSIQINKHTEADPDYLFTIKGVEDPDAFPALSNMIKDSLIVKANHFSGNNIYLYSYLPKSTIPYFTDLSVRRNFEAEKDIEISQVMPDTNYGSRLVNRNALKEKTIEQKAEEAANFLIKLKKRRFKLVAGQYDYMPEGESMASALSELSRLEEEYLALFIGRRVVSEIKRNYHYTPIANKGSDRIVLFRFSESDGFIDARETGGIPVMLELEAAHKTRELEDFRLPLKPAANTIPYRIADQVNLRLMAGEQIWAEAIFPVFQYGVNMTLNRAR